MAAIPSLSHARLQMLDLLRPFRSREVKCAPLARMHRPRCSDTDRASFLTVQQHACLYHVAADDGVREIGLLTKAEALPAAFMAPLYLGVKFAFDVMNRAGAVIKVATTKVPFFISRVWAWSCSLSTHRLPTTGVVLFQEVAELRTEAHNVASPSGSQELSAALANHRKILDARSRLDASRRPADSGLQLVPRDDLQDHSHGTMCSTPPKNSYLCDIFDTFTKDHPASCSL